MTRTFSTIISSSSYYNNTSIHAETSIDTKIIGWTTLTYYTKAN